MIDRLKRQFGMVDDSDDERPPKPDDESETKTVELTRTRATVTFETGERELIDGYGHYYDEDSGCYVFRTEATLGVAAFARDSTRIQFEERQIPATVLACEPDGEQVGEEDREYRVEYTHEWGYRGYPTIGMGKSWQKRVENIEQVDE